jgi:HSP20 family protein
VLSARAGGKVVGALFQSSFDATVGLQQALDAFRASGWLDEGLSGSGAYPLINVFRKGDGFTVVAEVPGVRKSDLHVEVKGRTIGLSGSKAVEYSAQASVHRRERLEGKFDRTITLPIEIDPDNIEAECHGGILALLLKRAEHAKPKVITVS